jgi:hypothetical protein
VGDSLLVASRWSDDAVGLADLVDTTDEGSMMQFLRRHALRIAIGVMLLVTIYGAIYIVTRYHEYRREAEIARKMESQRGKASFEYMGPAWIPKVFQEDLTLWHRIRRIKFESAFSE